MENYFAPGELPTTPAADGSARTPGRRPASSASALPRVDAYERVSGSAVYPSDVTLPGMLHAAVLRCPHAHARVRGSTSPRAEKMPGVHAVIHDGTPGADIPWHQDAKGKPLSRLFDPHCRHEGEEVAAVAAETPYQAWDAVRAIAVDYEVLPRSVDVEHALAPGRARGPRRRQPRRRRTATRAATSRPASPPPTPSSSGRFHTATEIHTPLEPHGCVARWDGSTAHRLGVEPGRLRDPGPARRRARAAARQRAGDRPLRRRRLRLEARDRQVVGDRRAARQADGAAGPPLPDPRGDAARRRQPAGQRHAPQGGREARTARSPRSSSRRLGSGGAYSDNGTGIVDWLVRDLYTCPNVRIGQHQRLHPRRQRAGDARARSPAGGLGARAGDGRARRQARRSTRSSCGGATCRLVSQARGGIPYTTTGLRECLDEGARVVRLGAGAARRRGDAGRGPARSPAASAWPPASGSAAPAARRRRSSSSYFADGSVNLNMGASDIGTGTKTVMAMIVAEELGVAVEKIQIEHADTATTQYATALGGQQDGPDRGSRRCAPRRSTASSSCSRWRPPI